MLTPAPTNDPVPTPDPVNHQAGQTAVGVGVLAVAVVMAWGATHIPADAGYAGVGPNFLPWVVSAVWYCAVAGSFAKRAAEDSGAWSLLPGQKTDIGRALSGSRPACCSMPC